MRKTLLTALLVLPTLSLIGCKSTEGLDTNDNAAAAKPDQNISPAEMAAMDAQARAMREGQSGLRAAPLGAPGAGSGAAGTDNGRVIYFDYDSDVIRDEYRPTVESTGAYLSNHPGSVATLEGHTDERGSREYNLALGERRANAVRKQISASGASPSQVRSVSYGEERPVTSGHDESAYSQNRRVEISY